MPSSTRAKSMFLRRLVLILGLVVFGMTVLTGQVWRLTVAQGAALRDEAESKLVTRDWLPTSRGRILDRKGRVLAHDRPCFDIAVDFPVISGEWANKQAAAVASAEAGKAGWAKLAPEERSERRDLYIPIFQQHLERMWSMLAVTANVSEAKLLDKRIEIDQRIKAMALSITRQRITRELKARIAQGEEITPEISDELAVRLSKPLTEQKAPHVVVPSVPDPVGFEFRRLAEQTVELQIPLRSGDLKAVTVPLMPGLTVIDAGDREYPFDRVEVEVDTSTLPGPLKRDGMQKLLCEGVGYHIIGRVKEAAQAEDNQRRRARIEADEAFRERVMTPPPATSGMSKRIDRGEYFDNDPAGQSGIEGSQEDELRGLRGLKIHRLDTGEEETIEHEAGRDVTLTIDIALQARVQAAMSRDLGLAMTQPWQHADHPENPTVPDGTFLSGAAVVLEIDTGDILAMVSTPTISRQQLRDDPDAIFKSPLNTKVEAPWLNRAISRPYPPGSIVKALLLTAAVKQGKLNLDVPIDCTGHLYPTKPDQFRCWIYKSFGGRVHGPLLGPEALMRSCNIYFFTLGQRLGPQGIGPAYRMFGLGEGWGLGIGPEFEGTLGSYLRNPDGSLARTADGKLDTADPSLGDATQMGIGQGPVAWTPLHAADSFATLARTGIRIRPHLVEGGSGTGSAGGDISNLELDPRAVAAALEGLSRSVNEREGTGHHLQVEPGIDIPHFNCPGVQVWGKTGTAQAPTIPVKPEEPLYAQGVEDPDLPVGVRALRRGDHSWFVVMAGKQGENRPRYVIAVMMEYAGSGGKVSGPIVNQVIHALRHEGYL